MSVIIAPVTGMGSPRAKTPGTMSVMTREGQYAACLLMAGPPDQIGWGQDAGGHPPPRPVSTVGYRDECYTWWLQNIVAPGYLYRAHGETYLQRDFEDWWTDYKAWLLETRDGQKEATHTWDSHARW